MLKDKFTKTFFTYFFILSVSFCFLAVCSKTSFLYPVQNWVDPNCFFTTAKSMANGFVLYRDIFEQKGLLLYLIHVVGYYISNTTFFGVYLLQVVSFTAFLTIAYKTFRLFFNSRISLTAIPVLAFVILTSFGYSEGDSAEEFCLPLLAVGLYTVLKYFSKREYIPIPLPLMFLCGIFCGCVLWIKYTILGFWFGFIVTVISMCVYHKKIAAIFKYAAAFLTGAVLISAFCLSYFIATDSVSEMFNTYFIINIAGYSPNAAKVNMFMKFLKILLEIVKGMAINYLIAGISVFGFICVFNTKKFPFIHNQPFRVCLLVMFVLTLFFVYIGGQSWGYYYICVSVFAIVGFMALMHFVQDKYSRKSINILLKNNAFYPVLSVWCLTLCLLFSPNTNQIGISRELTTQYVLSSYINQKENSTILNYGCLDGGFYITADKLPVTRYFCRLNIPYESYPQMTDEQNKIIKNKAVDFVIICTDKYGNFLTAEQIPYLLQNYRLVKSCTTQEYYTGNYDLYEKI